VLHSSLTTLEAVYARESLGRPKANMRVKAPFLIETRKWPRRKQYWAFDAGYGVSSLVMLRFKSKLKVCWVWTQGKTR
jgi:hypothetical protein